MYQLTPRKQAFSILDGLRASPYNARREKDVATEVSPEAKTAPWIPAPHADPDGARGAEAPTPQGPPPVDPLTALATFRRSQRLTTPAQFQHVSREGRSTRGQGLDVKICLPSDGDSTRRPPRLGLSVRKVVVGSSVRRNQWKRWLREAFRRHASLLPAGTDVVITVTENRAGARYHDLERWLISAWTQCKPSSSH